MESVVISTDALTLVFFTSSAQKQNESRCFVFAAFCNLSIEGEREEGSSPAVRFKGEVWPNLWEGGGVGEPIEKKGGCVAIFLGHEQSVLFIRIISWCQSVLYCTHCSKKSAKKLLLDNVLLLLAIISSSAQGAQPEKQKLFCFGSSSQGTQWLFENKYAQTNEKNRENGPNFFLKRLFPALLPVSLYFFVFGTAGALVVVTV